MFNTVGKYLESAATSALVAQAKTMLENRNNPPKADSSVEESQPKVSSQADDKLVVVQAAPAPSSDSKLSNLFRNVLGPQPCSHCNAEISFMDNMLSAYKCRICAQLFCSKCITKSTLPCPATLIHADFQSKGWPKLDPKSHEDTIPPSISPDEKVYVCNNRCAVVLMDAVMENFRREISDTFSANFENYLADEPLDRCEEFYQFPETGPADTPYRQAVRAAQVASVVADWSGFSLTLKAVKLAFMGSELLNILVKGDVVSLLGPLMESLKSYGIDGPSALLRLYYLGCSHTLRRMNLPPVDNPYPIDDPGVLLESCPVRVLRYVTTFVSASEWLYLSTLPAPHDSLDYAAWHLSRMVRYEGWTLLMALHETAKLPDGRKCPAFAVLSRCRSTPSGNIKREALVVIRGSQSTMDWSINLQEAMTPYKYKDTTGMIHKGIAEGSLALLEAYDTFPHILRLLSRGYSIRCIGHSLGAGVAVMVAARLRQAVDKPFQHRIAAVVFASPAICSAELADAFLRDKLLINVVNGPDPVPRFSQHTLRLIAQEMQSEEGKAIADIWALEDKMDLQEYVTHLGKAGEIQVGLKNAEQRTIRRNKVHEQIKRNRAAKISAVDSAAAPSNSSGVGNAGSSFMDIVGQAQQMLRRNATGANKGQASVSKQGVDDGVEMQQSGNHASAEPIAVAVPVPSAPLLPKPVVNSSESQAATTAAPPSKPVRPPRHANSIKADAAEFTAFAAAAVAVPLASEEEKAINKITGEGKEALDEAAVAPAPLIITVTPGPIIQLSQVINNSGRMLAAVLDHRHDSFQRMEVLPAQGARDHDVKTYRSSLLAVLHTSRDSHHQKEDGRIEQYFGAWAFGDDEDEEEARFDINNTVSNYNPTSSSGPPSLSLKALSSANAAAGNECGSALSRMSSGASFTSCVNGGEDKEAFMSVASPATLVRMILLRAKHDHQQVIQELQESQSMSATAAVKRQDEEANDGYDAEEETYDEEDAEEWTPCTICGLDVIWPCIMRSTASRALATHRCSMCAKIVCVVCAPAGDTIAGDGLNKTVVLPDLRIPLPSLGLFTPQRVCVHCYFDSSSEHKLPPISC